MEKKTVKVYDAITKKMVDVEVSDEVYTEFNRTKWKIEDNNESFYKHEVQFSQLLDEIDWKSLIDNDTEDRAIMEVLIEKMKSALKSLPEKDIRLIHMLFYDGKNERECAEMLGTSQPDIAQKKRRILCKLHKLLKK